ncbi:sugar phosphate isomerase/epimerase family protein [Mycolicibacterium stellerae]|uniref:sugar phosphate isomerase/epimerase family protein n=1 Tax=Mycolicibacterium stellerae TaxID=2358193 RepID=UPI000F0B44E5|nr:sugar phosphate isomerase/epimerase family protein [Mycolicibacterium stellerae]
MRYGYATISLPTTSLEQAAQVAAAAGFQGLECKLGEAPHAVGSSAEAFLVGNRTTLGLDPAEGHRAARVCAANGLALIGLSPYVSTGDLEHLQRALDVAAAADAPQLRLQGPRPSNDGPGYFQLFDEAVDFVDRAAVLAADYGVRIVVEIHQHTIFPSASLAYRLVSQFDSERVGVIYDVGNMVIEGFEDHRIGTELLGPYLHHVHLKNAVYVPIDDHPDSPVRRHVPRWSPLDDGVVDVQAVLAHLDAVGYTGWVSLEDMSSHRDPVQTLQHNAKVLTAIDAPGWRAGLKATF